MPHPDASEAERVAGLSEKQRESLRLTYLHKTSKEIAKLSGVTPFAIDAQIARAMQRLGVASRLEAAKLVMRHSPGPYERLVYEPPAIAEPGARPAEPVVSEGSEVEPGHSIAEIPASYVPPAGSLPRRQKSKPWEDPDELKPLVRLWLIPLAAFFALAIVFTLVAMGSEASKWARRVLPVYESSNR